MRGQIQKIEYEGYLADDAVLKYFPNGGALLNFRIGSTRKYNNPSDNNAEVKETTWLNCSITRTKWAEALAGAKLLLKGSRVLIFGRLRVNEYGGPRVYQRKDGGYSASFDVTVDDMQIFRVGGSEDNGNMQERDIASEDELPY